MIVTVTLNPSLDYIQFLPVFLNGGLNRCEKELVRAGGKGINVSLMLKRLGSDNVATGFSAGFTGKELVSSMQESGVDCRFVEIEGLTRINVKIMADIETEVNGRGPEVSKNDVEKLLDVLHAFSKGDIIVLSGSLVAGLGSETYANIMKALSKNGVRFVVDTTGDALKKALAYKPFLVKPNNHEISELVEMSANTPEQAALCAKKLQEMGAENVLCSLGEKGAVLVTKDGESLYLAAPKGELVNSVAAGDSMIAGFLSEYLKTENFEKAFQKAVACGSATAFSEWLADKEKIEELSEKIPDIVRF